MKQTNRKQVSKQQAGKQQRNQIKNQVNRQQTNQRKDSSTKYLCLFIVVIAFTFAFALLINKQKNDSYMNDMNDSFGVTPEVGKTIVARDMNAVYPKYYVVNVDGENYTIYIYNYYETTSQYELEYNRLIDKIVDYNAKDKMIRYLYGRGYGTYNEILNNLSQLVDSSNLKIY